MSKELRRLVKEIQMNNEWTIEQVAESIGYSRVHLSREMQKQGDSPLIQLLQNKHMRPHNVTSNGGQIEVKDSDLSGEISGIREWQAHVNATITVLISEIAPLISSASGRSNAAVLLQMKKDIQQETEIQISKLYKK